VNERFSIGSEVVVRTLGNKRGVIVDVGRNGRYRVQVEGVTTACRDDDLAAPPEARQKQKKSRGRARLEHPGGHARAEAAPPGRVDLHGLAVEEAIEKMMAEIDRSLQRGADRLEIVHGKGTGRIKDAIHKRLAALSVVARFRLDPHNPGVTWAYF
jgi:DNA mismatch repair protein MutS2